MNTGVKKEHHQIETLSWKAHCNVSEEDEIHMYSLPFSNTTSLLCTWMYKIWWSGQSCNKREVQRYFSWPAMRQKTKQGEDGDLIWILNELGTCSAALMQAWRRMKLALSWQTESLQNGFVQAKRLCLFQAVYIVEWNVLHCIGATNA